MSLGRKQVEDNLEVEVCPRKREGQKEVAAARQNACVYSNNRVIMGIIRFNK